MVVVKQLVTVSALVVSAGFLVRYVNMSPFPHERVKRFGTQIALERTSLVYSFMASQNIIVNETGATGAALKVAVMNVHVVR